MIQMTIKKNRIRIFGKTFHVTPSGRILPLGNKQNKFTKCMKGKLKGKQATGKNLSKAQIEANRKRFGAAVKACK